jgi:hypothetical protein
VIVEIVVKVSAVDVIAMVIVVTVMVVVWQQWLICGSILFQ